MRASLLLLLGACFSPSVPSGVPCVLPPAGTGACPSGQFCVEPGVCVTENPPKLDAAIDAVDAFIEVGPDDSDGDGVKDVEDNCPAIANSSQHDEDLDQLGDACDPCPPFAETDDPDGDGVAGSCDPWPTIAGDHIVRFDGFDDPTLQGWTPSGTWEVSADHVVLTSTDNSISTLVMPEPPAERLAVLAHVSVTTVHVAAARSIGTVLLHQGPSETVLCALLRAGVGPKLELYDLGGAGQLGTMPDTAFDNGTLVTLTETRDGSDYACSDAMVSTEGTTTTIASAPGVGLRSNSVSGSYEWVLVVGK